MRSKFPPQKLILIVWQSDTEVRVESQSLRQITVLAAEVKLASSTCEETTWASRQGIPSSIGGRGGGDSSPRMRNNYYAKLYKKEAAFHQVSLAFAAS